MKAATVADYAVRSSNLGDSRLVSVFLPPAHVPQQRYPVLFTTDGQSLRAFAGDLERAMNLGSTPPVVLVGVHSHPDDRNREYLAGMDPRRFEAHESFFTDEVYRWAHECFTLEPTRTSCGVFGVSCGAAFALSVAARHPEEFGNAIAFSVAGLAPGINVSDYEQCTASRFYLSAGAREMSFRERTQAIAAALKERGIANKYTERTAGHDLGFWTAELPEAIRWCYASDAAER